MTLLFYFDCIYIWYSNNSGLSFIYFDIISWLESKLQNKPVQEIIRNKAELKIKN